MTELAKKNQKEKVALVFCGTARCDVISEPGKAQPVVTCGGGAYWGAFGAGNALKQYGREARHITAHYVGGMPQDGVFGKLLLDHFNRAAVLSTHAYQISRLPQISLVEKSECGRDHYDTYQSGSPLPVLEREQLPDQFMEPSRLFFFGSSVMKDNGDSTVWRGYMREQYQAGHVVFFDPNVRINEVAKDQRAAYRTRMVDVGRSATIVRLGSDDVRDAFPDCSFDDVADMFLDTGARAPDQGEGAKVFIVTDRGEKAHIYTREGSIEVDVPRLGKFDNTVGAGDTFNAGILASCAVQGLTCRSDFEDVAYTALYKMGREAVLASSLHLVKLNKTRVPADELRHLCGLTTPSVI